MCPNFDLAQKELIPGGREWEVERIGDIHLNTISDVGPVEERSEDSEPLLRIGIGILGRGC